MSSPVKSADDAPATDAAAPREATASPAGAGPSAGSATSPVGAAEGRGSVPRDTIHHPGPDAFDLAQILRTVGDPLRLAMVRDLAAHDELLCGALGDRLGLPKSTGSYHLRLLREAGLTRTRQEGTLRYVSLRRGDLESRFPGLVDVLAAGDPA